MRLTPVATGTILGTAVLAAGCTGADTDASSDSAFTSTDSAGAALLVTHDERSGRSSGWRIGPDPTVVFGAEESPPVEWFRVEGAVRLDDGRVAVLDAGDKVLRYFAEDGSLIRTVGGEGEGPGEFASPTGPVTLDGDTVLVFDQRLRRFSLFDRAGEFLEDRRVEEPAEGRRLSQYAPAGESNGTVLLTSVAWVIVGNDEPGRFTLEIPQLRFGTDGSYAGEAAEPTKLDLDQRQNSIRVLTFGLPKVARAEDGTVYVADQDDYEVRAYPYEGGLTRVYRLERPLEPVTDAEVEAYVDYLVERAQSPAARRATREAFAGSAHADSLPALSWVRIDANGNLWVREFERPWRNEVPHTAVFAADGPWLGYAEIPDDFRPLHIGEGAAIGIQTNELGVQQVVEYPVHRE